MKRILYILPLLFFLFSCNKDKQEAPVHELTPLEQSKQNLDNLGAEIAKALEVVEDDNLFEYMLEHGKVSMKPLGTITFSIEGDNGVLIQAKFIKEWSRTAVGINLPDDMYIGGYMDMGNFIKNFRFSAENPVTQALDSCLDLTLYYHGDKMATVGLEPYHEKEAGNEKWSIMPVFRFSDGTSYAMSSLVLIDQFIDFFLKHEGSRT